MKISLGNPPRKAATLGASGAFLAIVGHHAAMSLEPAMALSAVLAELAEEERRQQLENITVQ